MKILINEKLTGTSASTVSALLQEMSLPESGVSVALDMEMLPQHTWASTNLCDGDRLYIIRSVYGG